ncbi:MAG TPA: hypothetical protein VGH74_07025, partial [Planctomycetaceae bacterium]
MNNSDHQATTAVVRVRPNPPAQIPIVVNAIHRPADAAAPHDFASPDVGRAPRRFGGWNSLGIGLLLTAILAALGTAGTLPRMRREQELNAAAALRARTPPTVSVVVARRATADSERLLPGNSLPLFES